MNFKEVKDMIFLFVLGCALQIADIGKAGTIVVLVVAGTLALLVGLKKERKQAFSSWMVIRFYLFALMMGMIIGFGLRIFVI